MADENDQVQTEAATNANLEQLRKKAERADELEKQLALRDKQDAFRAAKIDFESGVGKLVWDSFKTEGEVTADAVRSFAEQYGVAPTSGEAPAPEPETPAGRPNLTDQERAHFDMVNASGAQESDPAADGPVGDRAYRAFKAEQSRGGRRDAAQVAGLDALFSAAAAGDRSVVYNQAEWRRDHGA